MSKMRFLGRKRHLLDHLGGILAFTWLKVPEGVEGKKLVVMWDGREESKAGL